MTVGRPITAGRSRDRCVSNVVSNPISDAARAPSPLYRARGQRRPLAASGLPIRNDFGTLSRVDRFQHGESQLKHLSDFPGPPLAKDRDVLLAFYDFPAEHWKHIRTTNPIESTFATVRLRTTKTKGCLSLMTALTITFKLCQSASKKWRRLDGSHQIADIIQGIKFKDREKLTERAA